jgi:hypothetical protein
MCAGVLVENGVIKITAPILAWSKGKTIGFMYGWIRGKKGMIENLGEVDERSDA